MALRIVPLPLKEAFRFVTDVHRHHGAPRGGLFAIGLSDGSQIVGCAIVGRPVARMLSDGYTAEVTRLATDGTKNACSMLYGAAWRAARAMGYRRLVTYILATEPGTSLAAAGWKCVAKVKGRSWNCPSRPRVNETNMQDKLRYEMVAA